MNIQPLGDYRNGCGSAFCHCTGQCRQPRAVTHYNIPSVQEQMGSDSASKLAAAINRLCDVIEGVRD